MKLFGLTLTLVTVAIASQLSAQVRTFTSTDGRSLTAEIVTATPDMVTLKLENGSTPVVPLVRLSEADRAHIAAWRKANPVDIRYNFNVDYAKSRTSGPRERPRSGGNNPVFRSKETWVCTFKIQNRSGQAIENLEVQYQLHCYDDDGKNRVIEHKFGKKQIPLIKTNEILSIDADPVQLEIVQLAAGYVWQDGRKSSEDDGVKGAAVTLLHNGKIVHEYTTRGITKAVRGEKKTPPNRAASASQ
ncbi:hypothetical protein [Phragmitibacter flavus]|nr:hypothetical protein [Phragmitibacter flavus]